MLLLTATPLIRLYLRYLAGLPDHLAGFVTPGLLLLFPLPFVNSIHSWYRGILMSARKTGVIYWGMGINLTLTGAIVFAGVLLRCQGVEAAAVALIVALVVELYYLRERA